jgi:hypothetical protein
MGELEGLFVADSESVSKAIGKQVYFGEVLGKHSEIFGTLEEGDLKLKSNANDHVEMFLHLDLATGHNPLHCLQDEEEEEEATSGNELDEQLDHGS